MADGFFNPLRNKEFRQKVGTAFIGFLTLLGGALVKWLTEVLAAPGVGQ